MRQRDHRRNGESSAPASSSQQRVSARRTSWRLRYFKIYLLWICFPPMALLWLDQPVGLVLAYGVLGAVFMPFLAVTLLALLNGRRVPHEWRNRWFANVVLGAFAALAVDQVRKALSS